MINLFTSGSCAHFSLVCLSLVGNSAQENNQGDRSVPFVFSCSLRKSTIFWYVDRFTSCPWRMRRIVFRSNLVPSLFCISVQFDNQRIISKLPATFPFWYTLQLNRGELSFSSASGCSLRPWSYLLLCSLPHGIC